MNLKTFFRKAFYEEKWICAWRELSPEELYKSAVPRPEETRFYHTVQMPKRYWAADPFPIQNNGKTQLFFELTDRKKGKAVIGCLPIPQEKDSVPLCAFEFRVHASYPCVFSWNNGFYMIPETGTGGTLELLRCTDFPGKWEKVCVLKNDFFPADCTVFQKDGKLLILIFELPYGDCKTRKLSIAELDMENCRLRNVRPAAEYADGFGRPGGYVFEENGRLIRIVQPGVSFYGEKIEFWSFSFDDRLPFTEQKIGELLPSSVKLDTNQKIIGVHTFCRAGNIEVVDALLKPAFNPLRPFILFFQIFRLFGYNLCDKRQIYRK